MRWKGGRGTSSGLLWLPTVHSSTCRTCGHKMKVFPKSRQKTPFGDKMSFCQFLGKRLPINTIGGNPCRCWSGVSGSIKLPDYKTFSGMNTGGRGGGRGGAQTKTSHKIFLLEKHKVLSFFFFIYLVDTFTFSAGSVNRIIFGNNLIKIYPAPNMALLGEGKGKNKIFPMT